MKKKYTRLFSKSKASELRFDAFWVFFWMLGHIRFFGAVVGWDVAAYFFNSSGFTYGASMAQSWVGSNRKKQLLNS